MIPRNMVLITVLFAVSLTLSEVFGEIQEAWSNVYNRIFTNFTEFYFAVFHMIPRNMVLITVLFAVSLTLSEEIGIV